MPDEVQIRRVDERLSALGNVIACNDHVAIVHAELSAETEKVGILSFEFAIFLNEFGPCSYFLAVFVVVE